MHVAFALMLGVRDGADRAPAAGRSALWLAYPPVVTFVVVATANHWWLDAFLGAAVAAVAAVCRAGPVRPRPARGVGVGRAAALRACAAEPPARQPVRPCAGR